MHARMHSDIAYACTHVPTHKQITRKLGVRVNAMKQMEHAVYMCIKNYTARREKDVAQHGVHIGIDAWRKLFRDHPPLAEDRRNLTMTEFMRSKSLRTQPA